MAQLIWRAKPTFENVHSTFHEEKLFSAIFLNDAKKRVSIVNGRYSYKPSQEYAKHYCRFKLNVKSS